MTRLIEALKKAEEAKRKEKTPKKSQDFSLELEEQDTTDDGQDELQYSPEIPESGSGSGLSLEEEPSGDESNSVKAGTEVSIEESAFEESAPAYQADTRTQPATEPDSPEDDSVSEDTGRRLTDHRASTLTEATPPAGKKNQRLVIFALIALLLFIGVAAFFYWQLASQSDPYANLTPQAQNRGFLDSAANQETAEAGSAGESTEPSTPTQTQDQPQTQTIIGPTALKTPWLLQGQTCSRASGKPPKVNSRPCCVHSQAVSAHWNIWLRCI